jgi:hypothetical protein
MPDKPPENQLNWAEVEHHGLRFVVLSYQAHAETPAPKVLQEPGQEPAAYRGAGSLATALALRGKRVAPKSD